MGACLATIERNLALGNIECYIEWANNIPLLSAAEELDLAEKLKNDADINAAKKLILHHLRFVIHVAKGYKGYGLPISDLIQEGNIGLMKAIKKFDPKEGVRLISYAIHWIKAEIHEYVLQNVKAATKIATTKAQRKLFFNLRKLKGSLNSKKSLTTAQIKTIATQLNVPEKEVKTMEMRLEPFDTSIETPKDEYSDSNYTCEQYLEDNSCNQALFLEQNDHSNKRQLNLYNALNGIDPREKQIIEQRWLSENKTTLQELAKTLGISTERVRQLEKKALVSLEKIMQTTPLKT